MYRGFLLDSEAIQVWKFVYIWIPLVTSCERAMLLPDLWSDERAVTITLGKNNSSKDLQQQLLCLPIVRRA